MIAIHRLYTDRDAFYSGTILENLEQSERLDFFNEQYWATLKKQGEKYLLSSTTETENILPFRDLRGPPSTLDSFDDALNDQRVEFLEWSDIQFQGQDAKRLVYLDKNEKNNRHKLPAVVKTFVFSADDGRMLSGQYTSVDDRDSPLLKYTYDYGKQDGKWVPKLIAVECFHSDPRFAYTAETLYRKMEYRDHIDESQFYLSHYGIPEPDWYIRPRPYWLYASIAGFVLLVAGAITIRLGRKRWQKT